jgi:hypothetical protein
MSTQNKLFRVAVEGCAAVEIEGVEKAVEYARRQVYLHPARVQEAIDVLSRPEHFEWGYGFSGVCIYPITAQGSKAAELSAS